MPNRLTFLSDLSAIPQTPCPSAFRLKDMHREMFQPENILQENQIPKNRRNTGPAEGFQSPAETFHDAYPSAGMPTGRAFAGRMKDLKDFSRYSIQSIMNGHTSLKKVRYLRRAGK